MEFTNNSRDANALGVIGSAMKARNEVEVKNSYVHDTQGNGIWCDESCRRFCQLSERFLGTRQPRGQQRSGRYPL